MDLKKKRLLFSSKKLQRPYLRKETRKQIQANAPKNEHNQFMYNGKVINGKWDYGHVYGHENWYEIQKAEREGKTQAEFNEHINAHPEYFQIQPHDINISHEKEMSRKDHERIDTIKDKKASIKEHSQNKKCRSIQQNSI